MTTPLDHYETGLLVALREHVADRTPAEAPVRPPRRRRPRLVLGGLAALGAAAVAVILVPGLGSTPAYSVQEGNAGTIEVEVNRFEDAAGLERELAEHGIHADITYVADGGSCVPGRYVPLDRSGISLSMGIDLFRVTLDPGTVRDGETLVIDASMVRLPDSYDAETGISSTDGFRVAVSAEVARGDVPACVPVGASG